MRLKTALLLTLFFVGAIMIKHDGHHGKRKPKLRKKVGVANFGKAGDNVGDKMFVGLEKKVEQIEKKIEEFDKVLMNEEKLEIETMLNYVKDMIQGSVGNMNQKLSEVKVMAIGIYNEFMSHFDYIATYKVNEELINNEYYLNNILNTLVKSLEDGKVDRDTMSNAFFIWKYFIYNYDFLSNNESIHDKTAKGENKHHFIFKNELPTRRKRAMNVSSTRPQHILKFGIIVANIAAICLCVLLWKHSNFTLQIPAAN
ncbi:unnamed protein product [Meloidogyne enterolobii]|uniref:Uncharacterized protein n=1 Tax=Meloidogyne enterolobii TaxID=390850 RepID=A0ACB1A7U9_MELEN